MVRSQYTLPQMLFATSAAAFSLGGWVLGITSEPNNTPLYLGIYFLSLVLLGLLVMNADSQLNLLSTLAVSFLAAIILYSIHESRWPAAFLEYFELFGVALPIANLLSSARLAWKRLESGASNTKTACMFLLACPAAGFTMALLFN